MYQEITYLTFDHVVSVCNAFNNRSGLAIVSNFKFKSWLDDGWSKWFRKKYSLAGFA